MNNYRFTANWFDDVAKPLWEKVFESFPKPKKVLEIGCYEGKATSWLCENVIKQDECDYTVIDTFGGSPEEAGMLPVSAWLSENSTYIEENFRHNISFFKNINFNIKKGYSQLILPNMKLEETYDFIYIDASHRSDDTFVDAYYAHKMLKKDGLLIFDDYGWKDPHNQHIVNSPEIAVNMFCNMYNDHYGFLYTGYQIALLKIK